MPLYRFQVALVQDSLFPRDHIVNTLHFDDAGATSDPEGLCTDLGNVFDAGWYNDGDRPLIVKCYDVNAGGGPVAEARINPTASGFNSGNPREVALCLSYYAGENRPRRRGRIYFSVCCETAGLGVRPLPALRNKALAMGDAFAGLGGADVDWVLYSPTESAHYDVTNTWVDDEWDTIRSRGLRPSARVTGTPGS